MHQSNVHTKRKTGLWRSRKCISLVGSKSALTCAGPQLTPSHVRRCRAEKGNLGKFRLTFRHGAVFVPKQCLYQKEAKDMENPKMYSSLGVKSTLTCAEPQTTPSHVRRCRADKGNLGNFRLTFRHGAVFVPKQNVAMCMQNLKM